MAISVHPESGDNKSYNRRRRRSGRAVCGLWMPAGENAVCCSDRLLAAAGLSLDSESAGMMQFCGL